MTQPIRDAYGIRVLARFAYELRSIVTPGALTTQSRSADIN